MSTISSIFCFLSLAIYYISHSAVAQDDATQPAPWSVRLIGMVGSTYENEGRVEVFIDNEWGTVCDSLWSIEDANVVCRQLNYTGADLVLVAGQFGRGRGNVMLNKVECSGTEKNLSACQYDLDNDIRCDHSRDAGVICTSRGSLRLADATVPGEGRVEILGESGVWGTICDDGWDRTDAGVACRQLGYPDALEAIVKANDQAEPLFGPGSGPILLDGVECSSEDRQLRDCDVTKAWGIHDCTHSEDAGVKCDTNLMRMVDGDYDDEGRIEVYYGGQWGRICPNGWDIEDAHIACKELGYPLGARHTKLYEGGEGPFLLDNVNCLGDEVHLIDCQSLGWANNQNCDANQGESAGVVCNDPANVVRLLSGSASYEGVVQYRFGSEIGLICDSNWSEREANVTCRQLGYQIGRSERPVSLGPLSGTIFYYDYQCNGTELQLGDCMYTAQSNNDQCPSNHIAQVACGPPIDYDLRMTGSRFTEQGRLEVYLKGEWGYITAGYFSSDDQDTACRQLGYAGAIRSDQLDSHFTRTTRPILIEDISCDHDDMKITDCFKLKLRESNSTLPGYYDDACVLCFPVESIANHPIRFRDENGVINRNYGVIEIYHDGIWGPICDYSFYNYEIVCKELGHTDMTTAGTLSNYDGRYMSDGPIWFRFSYCPSITGTYGVEHDRLYECRHNAWGDPDDCPRDGVATARCIYVDIDDYTYPGGGSSSNYWHSGLGGWEIFLVTIAVVVPVCLIVGCCYRSQRTQTVTTTTATYSSATNVANIDGVDGDSSNPSPPYVPPSPTPDESPPTYESVTTSAPKPNDNENIMNSGSL